MVYSRNEHDLKLKREPQPKRKKRADVVLRTVADAEGLAWLVFVLVG